MDEWNSGADSTNLSGLNLDGTAARRVSYREVANQICCNRCRVQWFKIIVRFGEMPEWSNGADSKSVVPFEVPRVRIPLSPPNTI